MTLSLSRKRLELFTRPLQPAGGFCVMNPCYEIVDKYLYSPHSLLRRQCMTVGSLQDAVWPVRSCSLPIDLSFSFSSLQHLQKEETEELQRRCSSVTWRCLIQTTLLIYLYAVQLGFLHFSEECTVITQLRFVKVYLMYHKLGFLSVHPKTLSATLWCSQYLLCTNHV